MGTRPSFATALAARACRQYRGLGVLKTLVRFPADETPG